MTARLGWTRQLRLAALAVMIAGVSPVTAQILPQPPTQQPTLPGSPNTPIGSPLNSSTNQRSSDSSTQNEPAVTGDRIEPVDIGTRRSSTSTDDNPRDTRDEQREPNPRLKPPALPNEFEKFVERTVGRKLPRFGSDLLLPSNRDYATPATATVPPGYVLNVGDRIMISMTGSIEGSVQRQIDTNGRIFLPRVGTVHVAGVRYGDLKETLGRAIGTKFRNFTVNVGVENLRGVRVYVTGFANNPGAYTVNSLSTLVNAVLAAGGPSSGGSLRSVKLYRNNEQVADFDFYRLLLGGDRTGDAVLQNEDVLFIPPVGQQTAVSGSVNNEAIFEIRPGETLEDLLTFAGGTNTLADTSRLLLYRLSNYDTIGTQQVSRADAARTVANGGDIVQLVSQGSLQRSVLRQSVVVRIEGEVNAPGNYYLPPGTPLSTVLGLAGGLTDRAYVYGSRFERLSEQRAQREAFDQAVGQLQIAIEAAPLSRSDIGSTIDPATQRASALATLDRLRAEPPSGRIVLNLTTESTNLPGDFLIENNDRIVIPPRPVTVGVYGAVYRPASFVIAGGRGQRVSDYVERAGGVLRAGDRGQIFLVRANGDIVTRRRGVMGTRVLPGDVVFVPIRTQTSSIWAKIRDISTIAFQFGISAATAVALTQ